jgi:hypothetical protein
MVHISQTKTLLSGGAFTKEEDMLAESWVLRLVIKPNNK